MALARSSRSDYLASRFEMLQKGVPDDYVDSLLDDRYMQDLVIATDALNVSRRNKWNRYLCLNRIIFAALVLQAVVGIILSLWSIVMPKVRYISTPYIDNVDLVIMLDSSRSMRRFKLAQHEATLNFTSEFNAVMEETKLKTSRRAWKLIAQERASEWNVGWITDMVDKVEVRGGKLRTSIGLFNTKTSGEILNRLTDDLEMQRRALAAVQPEAYRGTARFHDAMVACKEIAAANSQELTRMYCVIMADNGATCSQRVVPQLDEICKVYPDECDDKLGNDAGTKLEYSSGLSQCSDYATVLLDRYNMGLVFIFTSLDNLENNIRLGSRAYHDFIKHATGCDVGLEVTKTMNKYGVEEITKKPKVAKDCLKFIMVHGFDDLLPKTRELASKLGTQVPMIIAPTRSGDPHWWLFLLLPLNLLFYILWSKIVRLYAKLRAKMQERMGHDKKKMVKVTKMLVEKEGRRITEVEMAAMALEKPGIRIGQLTTLRGRLRGAYIRENLQCGGVDGDGSAYSPDAFWTFEAADGQTGLNDSTMRSGRMVRIRSKFGKLLKAGVGGVHLVDNPEGDETNFVVMNVMEDKDVHHLGDTVRLFCTATNKFIRVNKDGSIDATRDASDPATQIQLDLGGHPLENGSIVKLIVQASGSNVRVVPEGGEVYSNAQGPESFDCWRIEKVQPSNQTINNVADSLRHGDVVMLKGISNADMEVADDDTVQCGGKASKGSIARQYIVERVGVGNAKLKDDILRAGCQITLQPVFDTDQDSEKYLCADEWGKIKADGHQGKKDAIFNCVAVALRDYVRPIQPEMARGDATLSWTPLWNKHETHEAQCLTAAWMKQEDMCLLQGSVVMASGEGEYTVPKVKGEGEKGWVAVIQGGIDIKRAAKKAKGQGANGLIVRCKNGFSLKELSLDVGEGMDLPTVFVDDLNDRFLDERGIVLKGTEFRTKCLADAMRSLGEYVNRDGNSSNGMMFKDVGAAIIEKYEADKNMKKDQKRHSRDDGGADQEKTYSWKITSNTAYLWSSSAGGFQKMNVNYGSKAPPSAQHRQRIDEETGEDVELPDYLGPKKTTFDCSGGVRKSVVGVAMIATEDLRNCRLNKELSEVLTKAYGQKALRESLAEDSDFKIEYKFEEVEVATTKLALDDQEFLDEEGTVVNRLVVPVKSFWIVLLGLSFSTCFLIYQFYTYQLESDPGETSDALTQRIAGLSTFEATATTSSGSRSFLKPLSFVAESVSRA